MVRLGALFNFLDVAVAEEPWEFLVNTETFDLPHEFPCLILKGPFPRPDAQSREPSRVGAVKDGALAPPAMSLTVPSTKADWLWSG